MVHTLPVALALSLALSLVLSLPLSLTHTPTHTSKDLVASVKEEYDKYKSVAPPSGPPMGSNFHG